MAAGFHLSVGVEDAFRVGAGEPPANVEGDLWDVATSSTCSQGDLVNRMLFGDALCGMLRYNRGTQFSTVSPTDQKYGLPNLNLRFDLTIASYTGTYGINRCEPWCNAPELYRLIHDVGALLGLTPNGDEAWAHDQGYQAYGGHMITPSGYRILRSFNPVTSGPGDWLLPAQDQTLVGVLLEGDDPVGPARLESLVASAKAEGKLVASAVPMVCAFSPQARIGGAGGAGLHDTEGGFCEVPLRWSGEEDATAACASPAYFCGDVFGPVWVGTVVCPMWHAACYQSDAWNSAHHWLVWHGVVAPSPPPCVDAEPGFNTGSKGFLAHDVDLYQHPAHYAGAKGVPYAYDEAAKLVPGLEWLRRGSMPEFDDNPAVQQLGPFLPITPHEAEPNFLGSVGPFEDTSGTLTGERDACSRLAAPDELDVDDWVNIVDVHVTANVVGLGAPAGQEPEPDHRPLPRIQVTGNVGYFADVDDDGEYEPAPPEEVVSGINRHGAYPMMWDWWPDGQGCTFADGSQIGSLMKDAGYGSPTGLAVALRFYTGPVAVLPTRNGAPQESTGPAAVILLSSGLDPADPIVAGAIDALAGGLPRMVVRGAFAPQCAESTGGFTSLWEIAADPKAGDAVIGIYGFTLTRTGPSGGGLPAAPVTLGAGQYYWFDVDPILAD